MHRFLAALAVCSVTLGACSPASTGLQASASAPDAASRQRGQQFAATHCAGCHAIGTTGASPHPKAPPLRTLRAHYAASSLEEALAEGITVGHPAMPPFQLDTQQISDLTAYLASLPSSAAE